MTRRGHALNSGVRLITRVYGIIIITRTQPASTASGMSDSILMVDLLTIIAWVKIDTRAAIQQYRVTLTKGTWQNVSELRTVGL